ncbi:MAG: sulfite exporter TauE/SafE family protein [Candidatus Melainabacteria bacterium]|nr:MAG: sulfite exporter TauE/SafE family protein [Candidatus Melainabacteria bacterium]
MSAHQHIFEIIIIGFCTGLLSGAFGIGGGVVCTPLLRLFLGLSAHVAVGTTIAIIIPTSCTGAVNYFRKGLVDFKLALAIGIPAMLGVCFGAYATNLISGNALMISFACLVTFVGVDLTFGILEKFTNKAKSEPDSESEPDSKPDSKPKPSRLKLALLGITTGLMAGFFGIGGGFILIPALVYLANMTLKEAFGTSLCVVSIVSIPGTITHALLGHVDYWLMIVMMFTTVPASFLGSAIALRTKDSVLKKAFGIIMLIVAITMFFKEAS